MATLDEQLNDDDFRDLVQPSFANRLLEAVSTPIVGLLEALNVPGEFLRGALVGKIGKRLSGEDFFKKLGVNDPGFFLSLAGEFVDPLLFAGSITGLTKAGKAAKLTSQITDEIRVLRAARSAAPAAEANKIALRLRDLQKSLSARLEKPISAIGPDDFLAATRLEQVAKGQRGLSFTIPFTSKEFAKTTFLNEPLEKLIAKIPLAAVAEQPLVKKFKGLFSTSAKSGIGTIFRKLDEVRTADRVKSADDTLAGLKDEIDKEIEGIVKRRRVSEIAAREELKGNVIATQSALGAPEKLRKLGQQIIDATNEKVAFLRDERDALIKQNIVGKSEKEAFGISSEITKDFAKKIEKEMRSAKIMVGKTVAKMNEMQFILNTVGADGTLPRKLAEAFNKAGADNLRLLQEQGVAITGLDDFLAYVPHILSREGQRLYKTNEKFRKQIGETIEQGIFSFQKKRRFRGKTLKELNSFFAEQYEVGNVFINDPFIIFKQREIATQLAVNRARNVQTAVYLNSLKVTTEAEFRMLAKAKGETLTAKRLVDLMETDAKIVVPLEEVLANSGMSTIVVEGKTISIPVGTAVKSKEGAKVAWQNAFDEAKIRRPGLPKSIAEDLIKTHKIYFNQDKQLLRAFDVTNEAFRTYLTVVHPSHFGTNTVGNLMMNMISLGPINAIKYTAIAAQTLAKHKAQQGTGKLAKLFQNIENVPAERLAQLEDFIRSGSAGQTFLGVVESSGNRVLAESSKVDKVVQGFLNNKVTKAGRFVNNFSEEAAKLAHFMAQRDAGFSTFDAIASTKRYLFDYGDLTDFEKQVMRRGVLFYTFSRKNLPLAVTETLVNRRAYFLGKASLGTLASEEFIPEYVRDTGSIAIGNDKFVDIRNPIFEANRFGSQGEGLFRVAQRAIAGTVPGIKIPFELLSGKETFRGRPIEELNRLPNTVAGIPAEVLPFTTTFIDRGGTKQTVANPFLIQAIRNLPTARIQQSVEDIFQPEVSGFSIFGPRIRTLPREERAIKRKQELLRRTLLNRPDIKKFSRFFSAAEEPSARSQGLLNEITANSKRFKELLAGQRSR